MQAKPPRPPFRGKFLTFDGVANPYPPPPFPNELEKGEPPSFPLSAQRGGPGGGVKRLRIPRFHKIPTLKAPGLPMHGGGGSRRADGGVKYRGLVLNSRISKYREMTSSAVYSPSPRV